ncbi:MAG: M20/M25/M40 family metallo-hydrolase [Candidatus Eisenbacteria bacterium]|nr:M20/M25/M40 family metallo-hydrolase [Candidatus Eisenbacteria bacterium]
MIALKRAASRVKRTAAPVKRPAGKGPAGAAGSKGLSVARRERIVGLLRRATEIAGLPGHETDLTQWFEKEARGLGAQVRHDRVGSCVALLPGQGKVRGARRRLMLAAHADAIGLVVTEVRKDGFLRVHPMGGVEPRLLPAQDVWVHGRERLPGVFGSVPPHLQAPNDAKKPYTFDELFVDTGQPAAAVRRAVRVGDLVSFRAPLVELLGGRVAGRAFDNRACVVAMLLALEELSRRPHALDVFGVATVQEEVGRVCLGAMTSAYAVRPDVAVALDVTHGEGPGADDWRTFKLGGGPPIALGPNVHPAVFRGLVEAAEAAKIPHQVEPAPRDTGTDARDIYTVGEGVPTGLVSVPLRYMHSAVETLDLVDLDRVARLLAIYAVRLEKGLPGRSD